MAPIKAHVCRCAPGVFTRARKILEGDRDRGIRRRVRPDGVTRERELQTHTLRTVSHLKFSGTAAKSRSSWEASNRSLCRLVLFINMHETPRKCMSIFHGINLGYDTHRKKMSY